MHEVSDTRRGSMLMVGSVREQQLLHRVWKQESCLARPAVHLSLKKSESVVFDYQKDLSGDGKNG